MLSPSVFRAFLLKALFALLAWAACAFALAGNTYSFDGKDVSGCTFDKPNKTYSCASATLPAGDDRIVIANGYTVNVRSDVAFGYNQGLTMSGSARLTSTGNLNIADIMPANLNITGGSFSAAKTFTVGNQIHKIRADISAGTLVLGSGSGLEITGTVAATGTVQIGSNTTITGAVSGSTISIGTPVKITGNITGTARVAVGSGATITGSITAPEVDLYSAGSTVSGNVTASKFLNMGSTVRIGGDVDTGQLKLESSDAIIGGNASVDFATLLWHGRVSKKIYCKSGTTAGKCDCVDNQSGYAVNSAEGPTCESAKPPNTPLHHFMITHDGTGRTCAPETVKVTACANQACTSLFTGGASVTLQPGGAVANTGSSGTVSTEVSRNTAGTEDLKLTQNGTALTNTTCTTGATASCAMNFAGGVNFTIAIPAHRAGESVTATITATASDTTTGQCVAAFAGQTKPVKYGCQHVTASATSNISVATTPLACTTGDKKSISTSFGPEGMAKLALTYQDAGQLKLMAELDDAKGETTFVVAPFTFNFSKPASPIPAGDKFAVTVSAWNKSGAVTPGYDRSVLPAGATATEFSIACVAAGVDGALDATALEFDKGVGTASMAWNEVGSMDLAAKRLDFFGTELDVEGTSAVDGKPCASIGAFIPKYFQVVQSNTTRTFYYAGEPIPITVSAMNAQGGITKNYAAATGFSEAVALTAFDVTGATEDPGSGELKQAAILASAFNAGVAPGMPEYWAKNAPVHVKGLRLRATNTANSVKSEDSQGLYEKARPLVYSGRVRVGNAFGRVGQQVKLPIEAQYWTGYSWLLNTNDHTTTIPASATAQRTAGKGGTGTGPQIVPVTTAISIKEGKYELPLTGNRAGWIDLVINLGNTNALVACDDNPYPASTGAKLMYLRAATGCRDPMGRATFGEAAPEMRRIIHMREVFN